MTTIYSQKTRPSLAPFFASRARETVLRVVLLDPLRAYYQRQLETATGLPIRAVQRELERLSEGGLLYRWAEGNRTYYHVDLDFPLFPELRQLVLKCSNDIEVLRGMAALDEAVRLCFLSGGRNRALVVSRAEKIATFEAPASIAVTAMSCEIFGRALAEKQELLEAFLKEGVDVLGRRDDVLWRHIEAAGYAVPKGEGVP